MEIGGILWKLGLENGLCRSKRCWKLVKGVGNWLFEVKNRTSKRDLKENRLGKAWKLVSEIYGRLEIWVVEIIEGDGN